MLRIPFPNESSKLIEFADNNFELDENGVKFPEKNCGKGEIDGEKQFSFPPSVFKETCSADTSKYVFQEGLTLYQTTKILIHPN